MAANGVNVPYVITDRRDGDVPAVWADTTTANNVLGWKAERDIDDTPPPHGPGENPARTHKGLSKIYITFAF